MFSRDVTQTEYKSGTSAKAQIISRCWLDHILARPIQRTLSWDNYRWFRGWCTSGWNCIRHNSNGRATGISFSLMHQKIKHNQRPYRPQPH